MASETSPAVRYRADGLDYTTHALHFCQVLGMDDESEAELQRMRYPAGARVSYRTGPAYCRSA